MTNSIKKAVGILSIGMALSTAMYADSVKEITMEDIVVHPKDGKEAVVTSAKIILKGKVVAMTEDGQSTYMIVKQNGKYAETKFQLLFLSQGTESLREKSIIKGEIIGVTGIMVNSARLKKFLPKEAVKLNTAIQYTILVRDEIEEVTTPEEKKEILMKNDAVQTMTAQEETYKNRTTTKPKNEKTDQEKYLEQMKNK